MSWQESIWTEMEDDGVMSGILLSHVITCLIERCFERDLSESWTCADA